MSNPRKFSVDLPRELGWPDGLCVDSDGGVWTARWAAGKVIRLTPDSKIDVVVDFPKAWNMTSCVFGGTSIHQVYSVRCSRTDTVDMAGADMDELYVTSAATDIEGGAQPDKPDGGSLFVVQGLGFKGVERFRYSR